MAENSTVFLVGGRASLESGSKIDSRQPIQGDPDDYCLHQSLSRSEEWWLAVKELVDVVLTDAGGDAWTDEDVNVLDFYADADLVAVIGGGSRNRFLWTQTKDDPRECLVEVEAATGQALKRWNAAAVEGGILYVAPFQGQIGRYNLADHKWTKLELPDGYSGEPRQLVATAAGLWLLGSEDVLYFLRAGKAGANDWTNAVEAARRWLCAWKKFSVSCGGRCSRSGRDRRS